MTGPSFAPKTIGDQVGNGMALLTQNWVQTQNALEQQRQARQQAADQLALQQQQAVQQAAYQNGSLDIQQQQLDQQEAERARAAAAAAAQNAGNLRYKDFTEVVRPRADTEYAALQQAMKDYGPSAGAKFSPTMYGHAKDRLKELQKRLTALYQTTMTGEGYEGAKGDLMTFLGGDDSGATPVPAQPAALPTPAPQAQPTVPAPIDYTFPPVQPQQQAPQARGDTLANGAPDPSPAAPAGQAQPTAPASTPATPGATSTAAPDLTRYARIQDVPMSELQNASGPALVAQFGEGSDLWAQDARGAYIDDQKKAQQKANAAQNVLWKTVIDNLTSDKDHPPTATQLAAAGVITHYWSMQEAGTQPTSEESTAFSKAVQDLAPLAYTPATWQKILETKDPAVIAGSYDLYKALAPDVVQGFNVQPFVDARNAASTAAADTHAQAQALLRKTNADAGAVEQTTNFKNLLNGATSITDLITAKDSITLRQVANDPEALKKLGITDGGHALLAQANLIDQGNKVALNNTQLAGQQTQQVINTSNFDLGLKKLGELATLNVTPLHLSKADPAAWYALKQQLGLNDASLMSLVGQAQYKYGLGLRGVELANDLAASKLLTEKATRAGTVLDNQSKQQTIGLQAVLGGSKSLADVIQGKDSATLRQIAGDHNAKVLLRITDGGANLLRMAQQFDDERAAGINQSNASAANSSASAAATTAMSPVNVSRGLADIDKIRADIKDQTRRTDAYVQSVKGTLDLDAARVTLYGEQTVAYRMKNPSDPLYNKDYANQTSGSVYGELAKKASLYTSQANSALKAATAYQKQIDSIKASVTQPFGGAPDLTKLPADQLTKLNNLIAQRDQALLVMSHRNASAEQVISDGLGQDPAGKGGAPATGGGTRTTGTGSNRTMIAPAGFRAQTDPVAQRVGINPQFLYGFLGAESSFGTNTSNYAGKDYVGPGQIGQAAQDDVNRIYGLKLDRGNPAQNMEIAARYYKILSNKYGGDPMKVYAAYNMGSGNFDAYLKNNGGKINIDTLPAETRTGIGNLQASLRGYVQDKPVTAQAPAPKATPTASTPPAPAAPKSPASPTSAPTWGPATAALPAGVKVVGSVTQFAQQLRQMGWFGAVAALKAGDSDGLHRLIQQATQQMLPTGTAEQRLAFQSDLWDSVNN